MDLEPFIAQCLQHFTSPTLTSLVSDPENRIPIAFALASYALGAQYGIDFVAAGSPSSITSSSLCVAYAEFRSRARTSIHLSAAIRRLPRD